MSRIAIVSLAALVSLSFAASAQQMYRWTDKDGKVHYSDKPPQTPTVKMEQRKVSGSVVETGGPDFAVQQAAKNFPVTMFTAPNCQATCSEARAVLSKRGVPFTEVVVTDEKARDQLKSVSGDTQVPVLVVGKDVTKGYEVSMWNAALDGAGYPKQVAPNRMANANAPAAAQKPAAPKPEGGEEAARPRGPYLPK